MAHLTFFKQPAWSTLADIAALTGAELVDASRAGQRINRLAAVDRAGPSDLTFFDNKKYAAQLAGTHAGACLVSERLAASVPPHVAVLRVADPYRAFVRVAREFHPDALRPGSSCGTEGIASSAAIHETARLEDGVTVDPLAVIGPEAEIGSGSVIGAGAVIGAGVKIGRDCSIGAGCTIVCALIGNDVIIHPGCRIGQDGYGFVSGRDGHLKVPQTGRVLIQNAVELGAGTTVDRGALRDTVIGEGTKIDNLVQVGHNVVIGRHCIIVSQSGIAGSSVLGDGVVLGARVGVSDHAVIGDGAQIAARSSVVGEVPAGVRWGGSPAKPIKQFFREIFELERLGREGASHGRAKPASSAPDNGTEGQG
ncbi:UDP-3-O-(3-hydroxymyristoyl)glucosamine N-acyltransferase [Bradyrhizobium sp. WD16]|uniref:UDP-3-O-(3-hydroxymyristoyl)glucosamine N-acyltransferase n=1 Tax=Bradyrhizobium sp. WD16 TaxID=1521768 RepID=UPI0020A2B615|nr:UDP-3-O-(3-hydroxymyristoyl)glucosamine N-acyltransferase [Bradyrhizobium sp. WD16]UTD28952.1 UDP-3-O-(3-hydroxymyristoyl)glucosamine N-acyltransferase [Bradyrhizobium sp. WD16]